jgi:hypothetical protein
MTARVGASARVSRLETHALRTPRSAAYAGIAFAVLLTISLATIRVAVSADTTNRGDWVFDSQRRRMVLFGLSLMPFAGIAFLWFVGVIRDRVGDREDRFFATLFLGSGLLFVAMLLVAEAIAAGMIVSLGSETSTFGTSSSWTMGHNVTLELLQGGLQVLGVFTTAASTILLHTSIGHRWLAISGFAISVVLITSVYFFPWTALLFPIWVLALSVDILIADRKQKRTS